jgi:hypothetical protein
MLAAQKGQPVTFDKRDSFTLQVHSAEIAITNSSMSDLLNRYAFSDPKSPIHGLNLASDGKRVKAKGTMHKGVALPFELEGTLSATPEGDIKLHADKIKSAHSPFKGLLHLFGEDLSKLINMKSDSGVKIVDDDIILSPSRLVPPPRIMGKVTAVRLEPGRIVQVFGSNAAAKPLAVPYKARNYIYHRGGVIRFGKLTMTDADLEMVDMTPQSPLDFNLSEYNRQLVAGYSKSTASHGLIVFIPDYASLKRSK